MSDGHVLCERRDGLCIITFNRPERRNALTVAMYVEILAQLQRAESDPSVRVIVFTGAGESFTSGNDIADFMGRPAPRARSFSSSGRLSTPASRSSPRFMATPSASA